MAKLLVVDDDTNLLKFLNEGLTDAGFEVKTIDNGADAIVSAVEEPFDLILLDMLMPGLDGIRVIKVLKKIIPHVPILGLTGYTGKRYVTEATQLGVRILTKPVEFSILVNEVNRAIECVRAKI
jgi:DNA-binding response OmpR family regulator